MPEQRDGASRALQGARPTIHLDFLNAQTRVPPYRKNYAALG